MAVTPALKLSGNHEDHTGYPFSSTSGKIAKWAPQRKHWLTEQIFQRLGFSSLIGFTLNRRVVIIWRSCAGLMV